MIYVAGAGRTGTTLVARVLQECVGVDMGGPGRTHKTNPTGDYECREIRNKANIPFARNQISEKEWRHRILNIAEEKEEPWGFKDPRSAHFLDKILNVFPDIQVVWAKRDFDATVRSWLKWYNRTKENCEIEIQARIDSIQRRLDNASKEYIEVDCTEWWEEEELGYTLIWHLYPEIYKDMLTRGDPNARARLCLPEVR